MPERTDQPAAQPTPDAAVRRTLTAMADALTTTDPDELLINPARIGLALQATVNEPTGVYDLVLLQTASIELPMARGEYAAELRRIAAVTA